MILINDKDSCCFIGHRIVKDKETVKENLYRIVIDLINEGGSVFLFGSKSQFNDLCCEVVSNLKIRYPNIKRIYVRAEYPIIRDDYLKYLLSMYEDTYFPEKAINARRSVYVERNNEMINKCRYCVFYYDESKVVLENDIVIRKSGTWIAYNYAEKAKRIIFNVYN